MNKGKESLVVRESKVLGKKAEEDFEAPHIISS